MSATDSIQVTYSFFAQRAWVSCNSNAAMPNMVVHVPGVLELAFRLPDNKRLQRRFRCDDTVGKVAAFLARTGIDMQRHVIIRSFPRKVYMRPVLHSASQACLSCMAIDLAALHKLFVFCSHSPA